MITAEHAQHLISLPKKMIEKDGSKSIFLESKSIQFKRPLSERYYLLSEEDNDFSFFLETHQSTKNAAKFTLHCQEDGINYGILRVDYHGRHKTQNKSINTCPIISNLILVYT